MNIEITSEIRFVTIRATDDHNRIHAVANLDLRTAIPDNAHRLCGDSQMSCPVKIPRIGR